MIGIDWGTTNLRGFLIDDQGGILETVARGLHMIARSAFEGAVE